MRVEKEIVELIAACHLNMFWCYGRKCNGIEVKSMLWEKKARVWNEMEENEWTLLFQCRDEGEECDCCRFVKLGWVGGNIWPKIREILLEPMCFSFVRYFSILTFCYLSIERYKKNKLKLSFVAQEADCSIFKSFALVKDLLSDQF
jgi:hypothetical protein